MIPDISLPALISGLFKMLVIRYWIWLCGAALLLALWISKQPKKKKINLTTGYVVLLIAFLFMPRYIPGYQYWNEKENKKMPEYHILIQEGNKKAFMPKTFVPKAPVKSIFPVPIKNAVGTIDLDNAITIMKFVDGGLKYDIVAKDFLSEVTGAFDFGFCNVYSDEEIAYTQTRWMVIANLKTGKVISPVVTYDLNDFVKGIRCLDSINRKFLIVKAVPDYDDYEKLLHIIKVIDEDSIADIGSIKASAGQTGYSAPWQLHNNLIFTYDVDSNRISCHDDNLKPARHPFVDVFNRNSGKFRKIKEFVLHPTLPFAIVAEIGKDIDWEKVKKLPPGSSERSILVSTLARISEIHILYLLRWDTPDEKKQLTPILSDTLSLIPPISCKKYSHFEFSPDGSWLVFRDETVSEERPVFISLPVDPNAPLFFGEPLYLGRLMNGGIPTTTAWTTDPLGFVVTAEEHGIWKWDLGMAKETRPIISRKNIVPTK